LDRADSNCWRSHTYPLKDIAAAYALFEQRLDGVIKVAVETGPGSPLDRERTLF